MYHLQTQWLQCTLFLNKEHSQAAFNSKHSIRRDHIPKTLAGLQWLPVSFKTNCEILLIVLKALHLWLFFLSKNTLPRTFGVLLNHTLSTNQRVSSWSLVYGPHIKVCLSKTLNPELFLVIGTSSLCHLSIQLVSNKAKRTDCCQVDVGIGYTVVKKTFVSTVGSQNRTTSLLICCIISAIPVHTTPAQGVLS